MFFRDSVWAYFLKTSSENLHVVLCMSPAGEALRNRCRNFPGLIGSTYIDWVFPWPQQALTAVAQLFLTEHKLVSFIGSDLNLGFTSLILDSCCTS